MRKIKPKLFVEDCSITRDKDFAVGNTTIDVELQNCPRVASFAYKMNALPVVKRAYVRIDRYAGGVRVSYGLNTNQYGYVEDWQELVQGIIRSHFSGTTCEELKKLDHSEGSVYFREFFDNIPFAKSPVFDIREISATQ